MYTAIISQRKAGYKTTAKQCNAHKERSSL